jgi:hypothetical protein
MKLDVWIEALDPKLIEDLFEVERSEYKKIIMEKQKKIISEGISLQYKSHFCCDSVDAPSWLIISIEIGKNVALPVALGILSSYLYDKLKNRKNNRVVINNQPVEIDAKKIEQIILTNINVYVKEKEDNKDET